MNSKPLVTWVAGVVAFLFSAGALAQEQAWLRDRRYSEGMGYRVGDLELHPGLGGEFGYDSNFFLRADSEDPIDIYQLRVVGSLSLSTLGPQRRGQATEQSSVDFRAGIAATYNEYIATSSAYRSDVSEHRNVGGVANFDLHVMPGRPWQARLFADIVRTIQPSNLTDKTAAFTRFNAGGGGELIWAPGGGLFDWRAGYRYDGTFFEQNRFQQLDNGTHSLSTRGRWRFLPRSALLFHVAQSFTRYSDTAGTNYLLDSDPLRARVGFTGLITYHMALLAMGGWGATFVRPGAVPVENYDGPIGQVQLTFYPTPQEQPEDLEKEKSLSLANINVGYTRDFANSYFGAFYARDRGYLNVSYFFAGRVLTVLGGGISRVHFPTLYHPVAAGGVPIVRSAPFNETRYDASLFAEYRVMRSVGVNATFDYEQNDSKSISADPANPLFVDDLSYQRFQAFAGVRWFM